MFHNQSETWDKLACADVRDVVKRAKVRFNSSLFCYEVNSLEQIFFISPERRKIEAGGVFGRIFLERLEHFLEPVLLNYLLKAKDISPSGKYVTPSSLRGGETFFRGSHELPFERLVKLFDFEEKRLREIALKLGGKQSEFGDLSFKLFPLPKIPVIVVFWKGDSEFPSRANILFDSTVELHLPLDLVWSLSMYTLLAFLVSPKD